MQSSIAKPHPLEQLAGPLHQSVGHTACGNCRQQHVVDRGATLEQMMLLKHKANLLVSKSRPTSG